MRFLIIDDSLTMRRIISNILARLGHTDVLHAANGREALQRIENDGVEFVITDWYMPEMNGLDFVRRIRGNPATQDLPILIVTANAASGDVVQAMKLKVNGYVLKPFRIEVLKDKIASICPAAMEPGDGMLAREPDPASHGNEIGPI